MIPYPLAAILVGAATTYVVATVVAGTIAKAGFPLPRSEDRVGCLDGLRGYLALSVLIHHFVIWVQVTRLGGIWYYPINNVLSQLGAGSVALFFMMTGFLFYPKILCGLKNVSWSDIYIKRIFRITPLIAFSVLVITSLIATRTGRLPGSDYPAAAASWITTWREVTLLAYPDSGRINAYVLWSLWFEWIFYLFVLPACALAADLLRGRVRSWSLPLFLGFGSIALRMAGIDTPVLKYLPMFAIGMLAAELQRRTWFARMARTNAASLLAILSLVLGMTRANVPALDVLPFFGIFFVCIACGNSMGGLLQTKGALVLGECSYAIYIIHGIFLDILFVDARKFVMTVASDDLFMLLPLVSALVLLVAMLTYRFVERPAIAMGARISTAVAHIPARLRGCVRLKQLSVVELPRSIGAISSRR